MSETRWEPILAISTVVLAVATIILIFVTLHLADATNDIADLEKILHKEREIEKISREISLSENLISEIQNNKYYFEIVPDQLEKLDNKSEFIADLTESLRLRQAHDDPNFGSPELRKILEEHFILLNRFKEHLKEIQNAAQNQDPVVKRQRINRAIDLSKGFLNSSFVDERLDSVILELEKYKNKRNKKLIELEEEVDAIDEINLKEERPLFKKNQAG